MSKTGTISIDDSLHEFVENQLLPELSISTKTFWLGLETIVDKFASRNRELVAHRKTLQKSIDEWHLQRRSKDHDHAAYKQFLTSIGYLLAEPDDFEISTQNVDEEVAKIAGPQLVVPVNNARFALNATNARWGSLYDALYGTDAINETGGAGRTKSFNEVRGNKVVAWACKFLDGAAPLKNASHQEAINYRIVEGQCVVDLKNGKSSVLENAIAFTGKLAVPDSILCKSNQLHIELVFDKLTPVGKSQASGLYDVILESTITAIMDCEDSVAAVDAQDKIIVYQNWLGLMKGTLSTTISKAGKTFNRALAKDRKFTHLEGPELVLPGRALMFARNVGLLMTTPMVLDRNGNEVPECLLDTYINACSALHDLTGSRANSRAGSVYFVMPKMHGPEEVLFANDLFDAIEDTLTLDRHTIKMGIMDEERRTSVNLKACIKQARNRVVFVNTGFLDRTGDEIHTSMYAGAMIKKGEMKTTAWIKAYEDQNVDIGLACGFSGKAQIGKGMWAMPDLMNDMLAHKQSHLKQGANTSWVPSPTAATLHATHYHSCDVHAVQRELTGRTNANIDDLLTIPLAKGQHLLQKEISAEIENNAQSILGYMVRWIEQGIGCSKVPDINNVGLMEDRATLRISCQHMANWLLHGVISKDDILAAMEKMASVVDHQNAGDPHYKNMAPNFDGSVAFNAACDLIFNGIEQPSGYTEPILHARRREFKSQQL